jgi:hypothetical protein
VREEKKDSSEEDFLSMPPSVVVVDLHPLSLFFLLTGAPACCGSARSAR